MHYVLFALALGCFSAGLMNLSAASSGIHEVFAGTFFVASAVLFGSSAIVRAVNDLPRRFKLYDAEVKRRAEAMARDAASSG